jgi:organic radical activating enzyme
LKLPAHFNQASGHPFCVLPWIHRFVNLGGEVQLCCTAEEHPDSHIRNDSGQRINVTDGLSDADIGSTEYMREIRRSMLDGKWPDACERCRVTEQSGGKSRRRNENQHFEKHIPWILENTDEQGNAPVWIRSRDYRLGNLCNLRCRMCHPRASKLLLDEWNQVSRRRQRINPAKVQSLENMDWFQSDQLWQDFSAHVHDLEHLHFAGGEPLVMPEVLKALELCVQSGAAKNIELTFNTNATKFPRKHLELWPRFKAVNLLCSVDAFGSLNDYIRYPAKWSVIEKNLDMLDREHESLNLGWVIISATVQIYNIFNLAELIEYSHQRYSFIRPMPNLIHLSVPNYFNIQFLPDSLKQLATTRLEEMSSRLNANGISAGLKQVEAMLVYMQSGGYSPFMMSEFRRTTLAFDQLRDENLVDLVPELAVVMKPAKLSNIGDQLNLVVSRAEWLAGRVKDRITR